MNLNQVTIPSQDLEISVTFYQSLGLILIVDSLPNYARFECPNGEATFSIHKVEKPPSQPGVCIYFECENLEDTYLKLCAKGIDFDEGPESRNWL
jgi:catechol 2,3-dioxygenase-like lactoylglutathione lyase family enzyme